MSSLDLRLQLEGLSTLDLAAAAGGAGGAVWPGAGLGPCAAAAPLPLVVSLVFSAPLEELLTLWPSDAPLRGLFWVSGSLSGPVLSFPAEPLELSAALS